MFPLEAELSIIFWGTFLGIGIDKYVHAAVASALWIPASWKGGWKRGVWFAILSALFVSKELRDLYVKGTYFSVMDVVAGYVWIAVSETASRFVSRFGKVQ